MAMTGEDGWPCAVSPFQTFLSWSLLGPRLDIYMAVKHAKLVSFHILELIVWSVIAFLIKKSPFKHLFTGKTLIIECVYASKTHSWDNVQSVAMLF